MRKKAKTRRESRIQREKRNTKKIEVILGE